MTPRFDPTRAVIFDLARGQLRDDEGASRLNVPYHVLARLCEQAGPDAASDFGRSLGQELGRRVQERLGRVPGGAEIGPWVEHLGGQVALLGLGNVQLERWGRAMVFRGTGTPQGGEALLAHVFEGALHRAFGRDVRVVRFGSDDDVAYLILSPRTAERAVQLQDVGQGLGQVVETLHQGAA